MAPPQATNATPSCPGAQRCHRAACAGTCADFAATKPPSQRQYAQQHDLPRSTLGHWLRRHRTIPDGVDPDLAAFLRSPCGEAFLRQLVLALFLVFHFRSSTGLRSLGLFLQLAGLDAFVASSYGALHALADHLEQDLVTFANDERARLAAAMPQRTIVACLDENFHRHQPYLVALEANSGFLLLEQHSPSRDADAWTGALKQAIHGLRVEVVLVCSDRAKGLIKCAKDLDVPHSPDTLHAQREVVQPILRGLTAQITNAHKDLERLEEAQRGWQARKEKAQQGPAKAGRPFDYDDRIAGVQGLIDNATKALVVKEARRDQAKEALRQLADLAHPYDEAGQGVTAAQVQERMDEPVGRLGLVVEEAGLSEEAWQGVYKGHDWVQAVMALVTWYTAVVQRRVQEMDLAEEAERSVVEELLPGLYRQRQASKGRDAAQRQQRRDLSARLLARAWRADGALSRLSGAEQGEVKRQAEELSGLFVRSSSSVEGRNGRLSLLQHGHVHLSTQRLQAQTALHNYFLLRDDGSTAAERFFAVKQRSLFDTLLQRLPDLPRPAAKRPKKPGATAPPQGE